MTTYLYAMVFVVFRHVPMRVWWAKCRNPGHPWLWSRAWGEGSKCISHDTLNSNEIDHAETASKLLLLPPRFSMRPRVAHIPQESFFSLCFCSRNISVWLHVRMCLAVVPNAANVIPSSCITGHTSSCDGLQRASTRRAWQQHVSFMQRIPSY